jgi:hypothetical protein
VEQGFGLPASSGESILFGFDLPHRFVKLSFFHLLPADRTTLPLIIAFA